MGSALSQFCFLFSLCCSFIVVGCAGASSTPTTVVATTAAIMDDPGKLACFSLPLMNHTYMNWSLVVNVSVSVARHVYCRLSGPPHGSRCEPKQVDPQRDFLEDLGTAIPVDQRPNHVYNSLAIVAFILLASYQPQVFGFAHIDTIILVPNNRTLLKECGGNGEKNEKGEDKGCDSDTVAYSFSPYGAGFICAKHNSTSVVRDVTSAVFHTHFERTALTSYQYRKEWVRPFFCSWLVLWVSLGLRRLRAGRATVVITSTRRRKTAN
ncbi:envelope glycoprotein 3 [Arteriviridae sp.]|nr:envelope glycoprotein 3 [Arteriviridae sp.]